MGFGYYVLVLIVAYCLVPVVLCQCDPGDAAVMKELKNGIINLGDLDWSDPNPCNWSQVVCINKTRITHIKIADRGLEGTLPPELKGLTGLIVFYVSGNNFSGPVPSLAGLGSLRVLDLHQNNFSSIPSDFFSGMFSLDFINVGDNPFSKWEIPDSLKDAHSLQVFHAQSSNVVGPIPEFFDSGTFPFLEVLYLGGNRLEGGLPASFAGSNIEALRLDSSKLTGTITVLQNMTRLGWVWLDGNHFTGPLPDFTLLTGLKSLDVSDNDLTGIVPRSLVALESLLAVSLSNNHLQGPTPKFDTNLVKVDMINDTNSFCSNDPGVSCDPRADILLAIAESMGYPLILAENWKGYDPCDNRWLGITCSTSRTKEIVSVTFPSLGLAGTISPDFSKLQSLEELVLSYNALTGTIPTELTSLPNLKLLDVSYNNLYGDVPAFDNPNLIVKTEGNPHFGGAP